MNKPLFDLAVALFSYNLFLFYPFFFVFHLTMSEQAKEQINSDASANRETDGQPFKKKLLDCKFTCHLLSLILTHFIKYWFVESA